MVSGLAAEHPGGQWHARAVTERQEGRKRPRVPRQQVTYCCANEIFLTLDGDWSRRLHGLHSDPFSR